MFKADPQQLRQSLDACGVWPFQAGAAFLLPKLALGKATVAFESDKLILVGLHAGLLPLPLGPSRVEFYSALLDHVGKQPLILPDWLAGAPAFKGWGRTAIDQYVMPSQTFIDLPGGRFSGTRKQIRRLMADATVETLTDSPADYLAVNAAWYRANAPKKFRTYDKTSIDWLLSNWAELQARHPDLLCTGIRAADGQLVAFCIGSALSGKMWTSYTVKYLPDGPQSSANAAHAALSREFLAAGFETANDGTADTKEIKERKVRLASQTLRFIRLAPP